MNKEVWKACLEKFPYEAVATLAAATNTKIAGFRHPVPKEHFSIARTKLLTALLRKSNILLKKSKTIVEENEWEKYRQQELLELMDHVSSHAEDVPAVLLSLLTSDSPEHISMAQLVVDKLPSRWEEEPHDDSDKDSIPDDDPTSLRQLTKKLERLSEKLETARKVITDLQEQNKSLREELSNTKKQYARASLQWAHDRVALQQQNTDQEVSSTHTNPQDSANDDVLKHRTTPKVALIGKKNRSLEDLSQTLWYEVTVIDAEDVTVEPNESFADYDEIWLLIRDLRLPQRRKILKECKDKIIKFDNQNDVEKYVTTHGGN